MKTRYIVFGLIGILFAAFVGYRIMKNSEGKAGGGPGGGGGGRSAGPGGAGGPAGGPPMRVNGIVLQPREFANNLAVSGSIEANEQVDIRSEVNGLITGIYFQEGSQVSKGQLLIKINDRELQAQLSQALTRQKLASETEYRARMLVQKEAISKEEYDMAQAELKSLQAATQLIRAQISKTQIRAPFSGRIGLRNVSNGEYLTSATIVARLVNVNPVKVSFSIPEKYSGMIKNGSDLSFTVAGSDKKYTAKVYAIEPGIEMATRTLQLRARAANPNNELLPGSFAKIDLPLSDVNNALLIPTEAIIPVQKGKKVFIVKNGKAKEIMIETSTRTEKEVLVLTGLSAGDTVLTTGMMSLKDENPVIVKVVKN